MRTDQHRGLNQWATLFVRGCGKPHFSGKHRTEKVVLPDGTEGELEIPVYKPCVLREESGEFYAGMFDNYYPLFRYTFRSGQVYTEYVQAAPWSSGPMFFLALRDEKGQSVTESLWRDEEIDERF